MVTDEFPSLGGRFYITSYGNGWAYEVEELHTGHTLWFQDDDADTFRRETEDFCDDSAINAYFETIYG